MLLIAHGKPDPASMPARARTAIRRAASIRCIALLAAIALPAQASESPSQLAADVLELEQEARAFPVAADARSLTVYIGSRLDDARLREVVLLLDGRAVARHRYSDREAQALQGAALHTLATIPLEAGEHRLRAEFIARESDAEPGDRRVHAQLEQTWTQPAGAARIELTLLKQGWNSKPGVTLQDWAQPAPMLEEPRLRAAEFLLRCSQPLAAAALLQGLQREGRPLPPSFDRRLADSLAALGLAPAAPAASPALERYGAALQADPATAATQLEAMGRMEARDAQALELRDLANLRLGYWWLQRGEGEKAKPVFARIRSPGPYSNAALLGFGWAFLVPAQSEGAMPMFAASAPLWAADAAQAAQLRRSLPFRYLHSVAVGGERKLDLQRALIPWIELIGRDATDPAVQEGLLAIPYALGHLGAHQQAQQYTRRAIDELERARGDLDAAMRHVASGELATQLRLHWGDSGDGWRAELADLPYADDTAYLKALLQQDRFLDALETQQRLVQLELALQAQAQRLQGAEAGALPARIATLRARVDAASQAQQRQLQDIAVQSLRAQQQQTLRYLGEARLALARIHDRPLEGEPS